MTLFSQDLPGATSVLASGKQILFPIMDENAYLHADSNLFCTH